MEKNKYDFDGSSMETGLSAENHVVKIAESLGLKVDKSSDTQDIFEHWDYLITNEKGSIKIDIKSSKKINRNQLSTQDTWCWIELQGVRDGGWLNNGKADFIVFEKEDEFWFINRKKLKERVDNLVDKSKIVDNSFDAKYKIYQRKGRNDKLSLIEFSKIEDLIVRKWRKLK